MKLERYAGKWVALHGNRIVASGRSAETVYKKAAHLYKDPILFKVPKHEDTFILVVIR